MPAPENRFKTAIHAGKPQIGLWLDMGEAITAEIAGTAGFDWLVIDCTGRTICAASSTSCAPLPRRPPSRWCACRSAKAG